MPRNKTIRTDGFPAAEDVARAITSGSNSAFFFASAYQLSKVTNGSSCMLRVRSFESELPRQANPERAPSQRVCYMQIQFVCRADAVRQRTTGLFVPAAPRACGLSFPPISRGSRAVVFRATASD